MKYLIIVLLLIANSIGTKAIEPVKNKPNIIFIMADDHTSIAVGAYGSRLAELNPTPNIDLLAKEGVVFENAFCINSICTPSRGAIMTGQYSFVSGITGNNNPLNKENQYLAIEMKNAGYETAVVGKWHLNAKPEAFDHYQVLVRQGKYFDPEFYENGKEGMVTYQGFSSDVIATLALNWLKDAETRDKPFFLKLHFKAPHGPFGYHERYNDYLEDTFIPEPASLRKRGSGSLATRGHNGELENFIGSSVADRHAYKGQLGFITKEEAGDDALGAAYQVYLKRYLRAVKGVDDNVQRVVDYLKESGQYENTIIIYTGDQGFFLGEHDYIDKRWCYDEAMRMPLIVHYPKEIKPGRTDAIVENIDFAPTMIDFAGLAAPDYMQGKSFRKILETQKEPKGWKDRAYYNYYSHLGGHHVPGNIAMRTKQYKLILFYGTNNSKSTRIQTPAAWELYDMKNDPNELNNLYDHPEYADLIIKLKKEFKEFRQKIGADTAKENEYVNLVIEEYWDYTQEDKVKAIEISHKAKELFESNDSKWSNTYAKSGRRKRK